MRRIFISNGISGSAAIEIAGQLGCKIETLPESDEVRISHPLIASAVKLRNNGYRAERAAISLLREIAALCIPRS